MKITCILALVAVMSLAGVFSQNRTCGTQPLRQKDWNYDIDFRSNRIVNGTDSHVGEWPWQVVLFATIDNWKVTRTAHFCGGVVITENHVLTAAHCKMQAPWKVQVHFGVHGLNKTEEPPPTVREVVWAAEHDEYNPCALINDVQVLFLDKPITFSDYIQPICFPKINEDFSKQISWVTGWGLTVPNKHDSSPNVLQKLGVPILEFGRCDAWAKATRHIESVDTLGGIICTDDLGGKSACHGDSGGPLVVQRKDGHWTLVGIVHGAFHDQCALPFNPTEYMRAAFFRDWIEETINTTLYDG